MKAVLFEVAAWGLTLFAIICFFTAFPFADYSNAPPPCSDCPAFVPKLIPAYFVGWLLGTVLAVWVYVWAFFDRATPLSGPDRPRAPSSGAV